MKLKLHPNENQGFLNRRYAFVQKALLILAVTAGFFVAASNRAIAQCPIINSVYLTEVSTTNDPICTKTVKVNVNYTRTSNGESSYEINYRIGSTGPFTSLECVNSGNDGATQNVPHLHTSSPTITYNCSQGLYIQIVPRSNGTCGGNPCSDPVTFDPSSLPVKFSALQAQKTNQHIQVQWQSQQEQGVKNYSIEASRDGINWTSLGTVAPKSENGTSNEAIDYQFIVDLGGITFAGIAFAFLLIPAFGFKLNLKKQALIAISLFVLAACAKSDAVPTASDDTENIWIRVVQHDINGGSTVSKVVKVANK